MKAFFLSTALIVAVANPSLACTPEELVAKAADVSQKIQALMVTDAQKASAILEKVAAAQSEAVKDVEGACKFYDEVLKELE